MEKQGKRFITRFRQAHDLYGEYISLRDETDKGEE